MYLSLSFPGKVLKAKWKNLKDKYRVELNKIPIFRSGSGNEDFKSKWPFFELMAFVKDTILPSTTTGNLPHSALDEGSNDIDSLDIASSDNCRPPTPTPSPQSTGECSRSSYQSEEAFRRPPSGKKRRANTELDLYWQMEQQKLEIIKEGQKREHEHTNKPDYHFFMSLLPYLEKLSPLENLEVRGKIQNIVIEAYRRIESISNQES